MKRYGTAMLGFVFFITGLNATQVKDGTITPMKKQRKPLYKKSEKIYLEEDEFEEVVSINAFEQEGDSLSEGEVPEPGHIGDDTEFLEPRTTIPPNIEERIDEYEAEFTLSSDFGNPVVKLTSTLEGSASDAEIKTELSEEDAAFLEELKKSIDDGNQTEEVVQNELEQGEEQTEKSSDEIVEVENSKLKEEVVEELEDNFSLSMKERLKQYAQKLQKDDN